MPAVAVDTEHKRAAKAAAMGGNTMPCVTTTLPCAALAALQQRAAA
jgi:hypothetical protein